MVAWAVACEGGRVPDSGQDWAEKATGESIKEGGQGLNQTIAEQSNAGFPLGIPARTHLASKNISSFLYSLSMSNRPTMTRLVQIARGPIRSIVEDDDSSQCQEKQTLYKDVTLSLPVTTAIHHPDTRTNAFTDTRTDARTYGQTGSLAHDTAVLSSRNTIFTDPHPFRVEFN